MKYSPSRRKRKWKLEVLEARIGAADAAFNAENRVSEFDVIGRIEADPEVARLKSQIAYLSARLHETAGVVAGGLQNRECRKYSDKIALIEKSLKGVHRLFARHGSRTTS